MLSTCFQAKARPTAVKTCFKNRLRQTKAESAPFYVHDLFSHLYFSQNDHVGRRQREPLRVEQSRRHEQHHHSRAKDLPNLAQHFKAPLAGCRVDGNKDKVERLLGESKGIHICLEKVDILQFLAREKFRAALHVEKPEIKADDPVAVRSNRARIKARMAPMALGLHKVVVYP
jgi:hypothetical protein